ncbi:DUF6447 family protein (plasmid) [Pseudomonas canadensis]|jgi:hypothetical protein|uniref:DUF6447 family protein n=1 Tax=Pseudomonas canadensis TaxID=915099 RepID=UPI0009CBD43B|nr:hypothetical protein BZ164_09270 [Pseudomonas veronii]
MTDMPILTLNGKDYDVNQLSDVARAQVTNIQVVDAEISRLQQQLAIAQTARNAYVAALMAAVESAEAPSAPGTPSKKTGKSKPAKP